MKGMIKGVEKVEMLMGFWSPSTLAVIESLALRNGRLIIEALFQPAADSWPNFGEEMFRVKIFFEGVGDLKLKEFGGGPVQIMGFDILYVGDRGMESVNFQIEDYEDDRISFNCREVNVESATLVEPS